MPDPHMVPTHSEAVYSEVLDDEAVVYDRHRKRTVYLSETATLIWHLCDGKRTIEDILTLLIAEYPEFASQIESDITDAIAHMSSARIIVLKDPASQPSQADAQN